MHTSAYLLQWHLRALACHERGQQRSLSCSNRLTGPSHLADIQPLCFASADSTPRFRSPCWWVECGGLICETGVATHRHPQLWLHSPDAPHPPAIGKRHGHSRARRGVDWLCARGAVLRMAIGRHTVFMLVVWTRRLMQ